MKNLFFVGLYNFILSSLFIFFLFACTDKTHKIPGDFETEKNELSARIDKRIESLNNDIERLRERANEAGENIKAEFRVQLSELEEERQRLQIQKQNVEIAVEEEWRETKVEINESLEEIERSVVQKIERIESQFQE